jgi:hypothetical protein
MSLYNFHHDGVLLFSLGNSERTILRLNAKSTRDVANEGSISSRALVYARRLSSFALQAGSANRYISWS